MKENPVSHLKVSTDETATVSRISENQEKLCRAYSRQMGNVRLRSTGESNIDETAARNLAANLSGAFKQFYSESFAQKQRVRKRDAVKRGRVPWKAPLGYINIRSKNGSNITPDPERAPHILAAFRLIGIEGLTKLAALKVVNEKGLTTLHGTRVSERTFDHILMNPVYAGWVTLPSDQEFEPVRGLHEAIVPQELFDRVQAILIVKKPAIRTSSGESLPERRQ
jgi:site-specific DNA recombinase